MDSTTVIQKTQSFLITVSLDAAANRHQCRFLVPWCSKCGLSFFTLCSWSDSSTTKLTQQQRTFYSFILLCFLLSTSLQELNVWFYFKLKMCSSSGGKKWKILLHIFVICGRYSVLVWSTRGIYEEYVNVEHSRFILEQMCFSRFWVWIEIKMNILPSLIKSIEALWRHLPEKPTVWHIVKSMQYYFSKTKYTRGSKAEMVVSVLEDVAWDQK